MNLKELRAALRAASDPRHREGNIRFFQEPVDPYGVHSRELKWIEREVYQSIRTWPLEKVLDWCEPLWQSGKLEEGALVCHVVRRFHKKFTIREFDRFEHWLDRYVANWAHGDGVASWLLAGCIANEPDLIARLRPWARSENRWKRRAAAVALLQEAKRGAATKEILRMVGALAGDPDVMVQKGTGWLLKESYPKQNEAITSFLESNASRFSRLTLRYAAEKMSADDRARVLSPGPAKRSRDIA